MIGLLALLMPIWLGFGIVDRLWSPHAASRPRGLLALSLGVPVGYGVVSLVFYLWLRILGPPGAGLVIAESIASLVLLAQVRWRPPRGAVRWRAIGPVMLASVCLAVFVRTLFHTGNDLVRVGLEVSLLLAVLFAFSVLRARQSGVSWLDGMLRSGFVATLAVGLATALFQVLNRPLGSFDAWATWILRARFLFRSGEHWRDGFSSLIAFSHPDYPLFVPATVANVWMGAGRDTPLEPACFSMLCALSVVALLYASVRYFRDSSQAMTAVLMLVGTALFLHCAADQTADIPLSLTCLGMGVLVTLHEERPGSRGLLILAGFLCGLGLWVKNDGLIVATAFIAAWTAIRVARDGWRAAGVQAAVFGAGFFPVLVVVALFKLAHAPPNGEMSMVAGAVSDPHRYGVILYYFAAGLLNFGGGPIPPVPVLIAYGALMGRGPRGYGPAAFTIAGTCALMSVAYFLVYLTSRYYEGIEGMYPPGGYFPVMAGSLHREMLHVWPAVLFGAFLWTRSPQEQAREA